MFGPVFDSESWMIWRVAFSFAAWLVSSSCTRTSSDFSALVSQGYGAGGASPSALSVLVLHTSEGDGASRGDLTGGVGFATAGSGVGLTLTGAACCAAAAASKVLRRRDNS